MQAAPQSMGHEADVSPHCGWQAPLPHSQAYPQSLGQDRLVSPQFASQNASPQMQEEQSSGHEAAVSPHCGWQAPLPQAQVYPQSCGQLLLLSPQDGLQKASPHRQ